MIKQIALPSQAYVDRQVTQEYDWFNAGTVSFDDLNKRVKAFKDQKAKAEAEYSQALDEGYVVTERYPFAVGEGINLVLYKLDEETRKAQMANWGKE